MSETPAVDGSETPEHRAVDIIMTGPGSWAGLSSFMEYTEALDHQLGTDTEVTIYASTADYAAKRPSVPPVRSGQVGVIGLYLNDTEGAELFSMAVTVADDAAQDSSADRIALLGGALRCLSRSAREFLEITPDPQKKDAPVRNRILRFLS